MTQKINTYDHLSPFSTKGRFNRLTYLAWTALITIFILVLLMILVIFMPNTLNAAMNHPNSIVIKIMGMVFNFISLIFYMICSVKRLHDFNKSGWLSLIILIPLINLIFMLYLACHHGDTEPNKYGEPQITLWWEK